MILRYAFCLLALVLASSSFAARADGIAAARYLAPTERYGHFSLWRPHEYVRVAVTTDSGRRIE